MGSVGNGNKNTQDTFVGRNVSELADAINIRDNEGYKTWHDRIRKEFNIPEASDKQIATLIQIIRGMNEYDRGYDEEKTPYDITHYSIEQIGMTEDNKSLRKELGMRNTKPPIMINISTTPNVESPLIRMTDTKDHYAIIGANGGLYTYSDKGRSRVQLSMFDVQYGKRRGL